MALFSANTVYSVLITAIGIVLVRSFPEYSTIIFMMTMTTIITFQYSNKEREKQSQRKITFHKLHTLNQTYVDQTDRLLKSEWPERDGVSTDDIEFQDYEASKTLVKSSNLLEPCHLVALAQFRPTGKPLVVGHVKLTRRTSMNMSYGKLLKMHRSGIPSGALEITAKTHNLDYGTLQEMIANPDEANTYEAEETFTLSVAGLVVSKPLRGQGLGKAMCAFALKTARSANISTLVGGCKRELVPFYESMGAKKQQKTLRALYHEMKLPIDDTVVEMADKILSKFKPRS
ncbi:unnamed protein product [Owenia fusiformis]|uniref:Uncharacterized protein n=1 Tax=Owenia fusiformis TaxID=6347 RepID=A0A8J1URC4_OWEFU|nr:unnamed protein product [Owenia fusiformis]